VNALCVWHRFFRRGSRTARPRAHGHKKMVAGPVFLCLQCTQTSVDSTLGCSALLDSTQGAACDTHMALFYDPTTNTINTTNTTHYFGGCARVKKVVRVGTRHGLRNLARGVETPAPTAPCVIQQNRSRSHVWLVGDRAPRDVDELVPLRHIDCVAAASFVVIFHESAHFAS